MAAVLRSSSTEVNGGFVPLHGRPLPAVRPRIASVCEADSFRLWAARTPMAPHRTFAAGKEIYAEGEKTGDVYVVLDGWGILYQILDDGRRQILEFALPGSILGFASAGSSKMSHSAEALTDLTIAVLPRHRLGEVFAREPAIALRFADAMAAELQSAYESLTDVGRRTARERVAHLLLRLAQRLTGRGDPRASADAALDLPLTLEDVGDAVGLTAVHVCRTLRGLREDGIVTLHKRRLRIQSVDRLALVAGA